MLNEPFAKHEHTFSICKWLINTVKLTCKHLEAILRFQLMRHKTVN